MASIPCSMVAVRSDYECYFGEGKQGGLEGAILWVTWLTRVVGGQLGSLTTFIGTPHTQ
jgi:hypothetical protein